MRKIGVLASPALLVASLLFASPAAFPHSGGLDASGCHTNHKTGEYHCHRSPGVANPVSGIVKKSNSGICHAPSSRWYAQTIHYTEYRSLQECLDSGGRLPKG
jgi:hypothetical protein